MKHFKAKDCDTHFEVHDARDGTSFKVPKKGLSPGALKRVQAFAYGGEVLDALNAANTGTILPPDGGVPAQAEQPAFAGDMVAAPPPAVDAGTPPPAPAPTGPVVNELPPELKSVVEGDTLGDDKNARRAEYDSAMGRIDNNVAKAKADDVAAQKAKDEQAASEAQKAVDDAKKQDAGQMDAFTKAVTTAPTAAPTFKGGNGPAYPAMSPAPSTSGLDAAAAQQQQAEKARADIIAQKAKDQASIQEGLAAQQKEAAQRFDRNFTIAQGVSAALGVATALQRVDPNKYWADKSTGQKMMAGAAMVLGGASQGTLKGENPGVRVIEQSIDRDIRAQQDNIKQFSGLYSMHLKTMESMESAYNQTKADMLSVAQTRIQQLASKYAGPEAQANAQAAIAELEQKKQQALYNVAAQNTARQDAYNVGKANYGVEQSKLGMERQKLNMLAKAGANPGGLDPSKIAALAATGREVPGEYQGLLPKELGERAITVRPGWVRLAANKKVADEANEAISTHQKLQSAIQNIKQYGSKAGVWPDADKQKYQTALFELSTGMAHELFGRVTESDVNLVKNALPDKTSLWTTDAKANAALDSLLMGSKKKADAAIKTALPGGK